MLTVTDIELNRLVPSPRNVRRTGPARIEEPAASIMAHGLLQNLTVVETITKGKKTYEVIAGGRRLAALKLLVKRKQVAANAPIPCHVVADANVTELSLAENALQEPMHPADQFDAFHALSNAYGMSAEDIAARFGVTAAVVKARLKLAVVSPKLIEAYRQDEMNLDQLSAFTLTDDQERQERVWANRGCHDRRDDLVSALMVEHVDATDPVALFVTAEAYQAAGGILIRDLFDAEGEGYFADLALLDALADARLQAAAEEVRAEGWKWVATARRYDYAMTSDMRRLYPRLPELPAEDQQKLDALEQELERCDASATYATQDEIDTLERAIASLRGEEAFAPEEIARAGAFVTIDYDGTLRIERGFIRPEDDPGSPSQPRVEKKRAANALSAKLVEELTAHQTMSLRDALGANGPAALVAVTHALATALFLRGDRRSCLDLRASSRCLDGIAPGIADSPAGQRIAARHEAWAKRLPEDAADLWGFVAGLSEAERLALLAHCVGLSVDAVRVSEAQPKDGLADLVASVGLDMRQDWQPTAAGYLGRVSRAGILAAVREGVSPEAADNLAGLKKAALVAEAERRLKDKGWLPPILRPAA